MCRIERVYRPVHPVEDDDADDLAEGDDEERDRAHVTVEDLQPVVPRSQREDQRHEEVQQTDQTCSQSSVELRNQITF